MIAWNNKQLIATFFHENTKPSFDTATKEFRMPTDVSHNAELMKEVNAYFTQKTDASMASVEPFTSMFKEKADGYAFTSSNGTLGTLSMMPLQLPKLEELVKDNYSASTLSFEDGRIIAHSTTYTNPMVSSILKQYAGPVVNMSMLEHYPSEHINGIMLASFNPEIFSGVLKQLEVEGLVNGFLQKAGFSSQDVYKAMKGDIAVIVSDLGIAHADPGMKQDEKSMIRNKPMGKMIFNMAIGDQASFYKLMDKAAEMGYVVKQGNTYKGGSLLSVIGLYLVADNKNLILASDSLTYSQYVSNSRKALISSDVTGKLKGKSTAFYFDIATTIKDFMQNPNGGSYDRSMQTASETFKDIIGSSDNFDGTSVKAVMEIRMQNEKQNSLVTLTSLLTDIAVDMHTQAKKEKQMDGMFPGGVPAIIRTN